MSYQMTLQDSPRYLSGEYDYEVVGGDTIYYHNYPDVSSTNNLGSVASGGFLARAVPSWVVSAGTSYIAQRDRAGTTDPSLVEPADGAGSFYNAATRTFEMVTPTEAEGDPLDVRDYGAVGDGSTDDTAAIQAAIDALPEPSSFTHLGYSRVPEDAAGTVLFPSTNADGDPAVYKITSALKVATGQSFTGYGATIDHQGTDAIFEREELSGIPYGNVYLNFEGLMLKSSTGTATSAFDLVRCNYCTFRQLHIKGFASHGLYLEESQYCLIEAVDSRYNEGYGIYFDTGETYALPPNNNTLVRVCCEFNVLGGLYINGSIDTAVYGSTFQLSGRRTNANGEISDVATELVVDDASLAPTSGKLKVGPLFTAGEIISYSNISGNTVTLSARGEDGTSAATIADDAYITFLHGAGIHITQDDRGVGSPSLPNHAPGPTYISGCHFEDNTTHVELRAIDPDTSTRCPFGTTITGCFFGQAPNVQRWLIDEGEYTVLTGGSGADSTAHASKDGSFARIEAHSVCADPTIMNFRPITSLAAMVCDEDGNERDLPTGGLVLPGDVVSNVPSVYNVKRYGATGDGSTDDTAAIQAAMDAAEAVGGGSEVYFPAGSYSVTGAITIPATVNVCGPGIPSTAHTVPTVASAAGAITIAATAVVNISGTETITSITASYVGRIVTLVATGAWTLTDGSNLKLAGNFTPAAGDTITLVSDGTNWIEIARADTT